MSMPQQCRDVLIEKNLETLDEHRVASLFLMSVVNEQSFDSMKRGVGASYGLFSGNYSELRQRVRAEQRAYRYQFDESEAISALTLTGYPGAVEAWRDCMRAKRAGLFCSISGNVRGEIFTIKLEWAPPLPVGGKPLIKVQEFVTGEHFPDPEEATPKILAWFEEDVPSILEPGEHSFSVRRGAPSVALYGHVNAKIGSASYTTAFFIPTYPGSSIPLYYLSEHPESLGSVKNIHGKIQLGGVYWQDRVRIGGVEYRKAVGMHAPDNVGFAEFQIPRRVNYFRSVFGLAEQNGKYPGGRSEGRIYIDGEEVWRRVVSSNDVTQTHSLGIPRTASVLRLEVDGLGNKEGAHTTWGDPHFSSD